jgi:hypothetical protein
VRLLMVCSFLLQIQCLQVNKSDGWAKVAGGQSGRWAKGTVHCVSSVWALGYMTQLPKWVVSTGLDLNKDSL